ncbi:FecCD family ABC transporter permease [Streptomyces sp. NPDC059853]|uniref:FecCD family ABC transporter permease n=1 Tax=Streptomyces sp. NPDC059853 TaxID=3346973 RepID=UPI0036481416
MHTDSQVTGSVRRARRARQRRTVAVCAALLAAALAAFLLSLATGDKTIALPDLLATLTGGGSRGDAFIVLELRLPRAVTAVGVGVAFGLAGAVFQSLLRNPLASPDVIGISAGASAAAVISIVLLGLSGPAVSLTALAGGLTAAVLIYALAWRRGVTGYRLVLIGVGVASALTSTVSYVMTRSETMVAQQAFVWLAGSLNGRSWDQARPLLLALALLLPLTALAARALPVLQLGDDTARGLGARTEPSRVALLLCAVALAGVATAAAGPVGFVAFVSAPIARGLLRRQDAALLPAALTGAVVVLLSDYIGQHLLGPHQIPVGVVTSVVGAPYLLWLLATANRVGRGG